MNEHWTQPEPVYKRKLAETTVSSFGDGVKIRRITANGHIFLTFRQEDIPELIEALQEVLEGPPEQ